LFTALSLLSLLLCVATFVLWVLRSKQGDQMKTVPKTKFAPVIRTDFSDDAEWQAVKQEIAQPSVEVPGKAGT
jgi:hypothetical protein